jgi:hypothetical protein
MKTIHNYILPLILVASLASCEKEITVDVPKYDEKLVLNSFTMSGDTMYVGVGKSIGILDYKHGKDLNVMNATILLQADGKTVDTMKYNTDHEMYASHTVAETGKQYTVKATAPGYTEAEATTTVPEIVTIDSIIRIPNAKLDIDGNTQDEIRIVFKDPPAAGDYYILKVFTLGGLDTNYNHSGMQCVNTTDPSVESIYNENIDQTTCLSGDGIFFRDALFNGTRKELRLFIQSHFLSPLILGNDTVRGQVELTHVTEAYFKFSKSYKFATENTGNPFAEPTNVYTNVKNGYGIFSVMSYATKEIK